MLKKLMLTGFAAAAVFLAGCGGGGGDASGNGDGDGSGGSTPAVTVKGPLDPLQDAISNTVLMPLEGATAGTPLQGVLVCVDAGVNRNTLDIVDALLLGAQDPTALSTTTPAQIQTQLTQLAANLQALLTGLAGQDSCSSTSVGTGGLSSNPLAGTPLAPLGDALLPVLAQIQAASAGGSGGSGGGFASLAQLVNELNAAFKSGLAQIPADARTAPVLGGVFTTITTSLDDLSLLLNAINANDGAAATTGLQNTLDHLLVNVLTQVVPASFIETQAGQPGAFTGPIDAAAAQFSAQVAAALGQGVAQLIDALNSPQFAPVFDPVVNQLLPAIVDPITQALSGSGTGGTGGIPTGTPLDAVLAPLATVLGSLSGASGGGDCAFASIPLLSVLCSVIP